MGGLAFAHIRRVAESDNLSDFSSGCSVTDDWLKRNLKHAASLNTARMYVLPLEDGTICGYYTWSAHAVARASDLIGGVRRNAPDPIPCTLLGQLAVDARFQGKSAGARLLQDAIERTARASMVVASRALIVDPSDERAEGFYQRFGFRRLSGGSCRMFLPL